MSFQYVALILCCLFAVNMAGLVSKPWQCPANQNPGVMCPAVVRPEDCTGDMSCPGDKKCCKQGCFRVCQTPDCLLPKKPPGPCEAAMTRYYYDKNQRSCRKFIYGGCQGNANNFMTLEACQKKCVLGYTK